MAGYDNPWEAGGLREDGYWQMDPRAFRGPPSGYEQVQAAYGGDNPLEAIRRDQMLRDQIMRQSGGLMTDPESQRALQQLNTMQPAAKMPQKPATNTDEFLRMRSGGR